MSHSQRTRDLLLLAYGVILGIMGNVMAEYVLALAHPRGITQLQGLFGTIIIMVVQVGYFYIFQRYYLKSKR